MITPDSTELVTRNNNILVFTELKKYAQEEIDDNHYSESSEDYLIQCPYCVDAYKHDSSYEGPYTKYKLYVAKDLSYGHCFRCSRIFVNRDDELNLNIRPLTETNKTEFKLDKLNHRYWNENLFNQFSSYDEQGYNYLIKKRHKYFSKLATILNIKYLDHNPVIPFYYKGELIFYQIKLAFGDSKIPYFTPPINHKPAYIIEHGDNKKFVICEGTFDAIACMILFPDRTPFAVLGSSITSYQLWMLRSYLPEDILIFMDETSISLRVKNSIVSAIDYAVVNIRPSSGMDPEEYLKYKLGKESELL